MTTVEDRLTVLETEFRTELKHLATKTDLVELKADLQSGLKGDLLRVVIGLASLQLLSLGAVAAMLRFLG